MQGNRYVCAQYLSMDIMSTYYTQVFNRLQKLGLCISRSSTICLLNDLGYTHDDAVIQWREITANDMCKYILQLLDIFCCIQVNVH